MSPKPLFTATQAGKPVRISSSQVAAFRLARHHLADHAPLSSMPLVAGDIGGAQAQVLSAAQIAIWARVKNARIQDVDSAIWKDRTLVRAWCMRRTLFLLPARDLAVFVHGTGRRADYNLRYAQSRIKSEKELDKLLDAVLAILVEPRTRNELAQALNKSYGYKLKFKAGGGWGDRRAVPNVEAGGLLLPVGFILHMIGARDAICSGPSIGNESTYVRADKWLQNWRDLPREKAERELLVKYLRAFGPSTLTDFALWAGMYVRDAKPIWETEAENMVPVDVEGEKAAILRSDLSSLREAEVDKPIVRLLPFFDSYLLGHKSHRNIIGADHHKKVYRAQGWVSPVILVNGHAHGVWSHTQSNGKLEVRITPFARLPDPIIEQVREEAEHLRQFLGSPSVNTVIR